MPDTDWHQLSTSLAAAQGSDQLVFSVYGGNLATGRWFHADLMSLTSPS